MMSLSWGIFDRAKKISQSTINQVYDIGLSLSSSIASYSGKAIYSIKDMIYDRGLCYMCKSSNIINVPCKHCLCRFCLTKYISVMTETEKLDFVPCFICEFPIAVIFDEYIDSNEENKFPEEEEEECKRPEPIEASDSPVIESKKESISRPAPMFLCEIDRLEHSMDDAFTLECDHRFCRSCIEQWIIFKIDSNEVREDQLGCPTCQNSITVHEVFGAVPFNKYMLYINIKDRAAIVDGLPVKQCPHCEALVSIPENMKRVVCPNKLCKRNYCPQCNKDYHPNKSCQEMNKSESEEEIPGIAKCPKCGEGYFKENGCNFVNCTQKCQRLTHFCFLCGKKLQRSQHYSHFWKSGPFGNSCNTLDGINDD